MAKVYMTEYARTALDSRTNVPSGEEPSIKTTVLDTAATHLSSVLDPNTRLVRLHTDSIISFKFSIASTAATTSDARMAAGSTEYFGVPPPPAGGVSLIKCDVIVNT